jgi:hypothetical protein
MVTILPTDHVDGPGHRYYRVDCGLCGFGFVGQWRVAQAHRNRHRCPAGTEGAYPRCPVCDSRTDMCFRRPATPRGDDWWHDARRRTYTDLVAAARRLREEAPVP